MMVCGVVAGSGGGTVPDEAETDGWLRPRADMMASIVDALMPVASVRAAAAR